MTDIPLIVTAAWLRDHRGKKNIKILDASSHLPTTGRDAKTEFIAQRIPGAGRFDIDKIADTASPLPHMLPPADLFALHMQTLGLNDDDHVIVYCDSAILSSARAWWMLRLFGHSRVSLLNGGLQSWLTLDGETDSGPEHPIIKGKFSIRPAVGAAAINLASLQRLVEEFQMTHQEVAEAVVSKGLSACHQSLIEYRQVRTYNKRLEGNKLLECVVATWGH